ncbi:MAG: hypothetical protein PHW89_07955 [Sulfurimonas denitrificans]|nr:hypothetical protein [Sulfurimonas denitrificans]
MLGRSLKGKTKLFDGAPAVLDGWRNGRGVSQKSPYAVPLSSRWRILQVGIGHKDFTKLINVSF